MIEGYTIWNGTDVLTENDKRDVCWGEPTDIVWSDNPYCCDDVFLVQKAAKGVDIYGGWKPSFDHLTDEEKDKFITLVCRVEGYFETKETKKKLKKSITAKQIELTVNEVLKSVNVKLIKG